MSLEWQYRIQIWPLQRTGGEIKLEQAQRRATMVTGGTESLPYGRRQETWLVHLGKQKLKGDRSAVRNTSEEQISRRGKTIKIKANFGMRTRRFRQSKNTFYWKLQ